MNSLTIIIFGGTGDLAKRKLIPAISNLIENKQLNKKTTIIGISRSDLGDEEYKSLISKNLNDKQKQIFKKINVKQLSLNFSDSKELSKLKDFLKENSLEKSEKIYYLATSFKLFPEIVKGLKKFHLNEKSSKIAFEKPFGENLKSSNTLEKKIHKSFSEKQIYHIDHYLAKQSIENISILKSENSAFARKLNNKFVKSIEISVLESLGVEKRLEYYNKAGALKDMIQNHLLQVLSILLVPKSIKSLHKNKIKVLKSLSLMSDKENILGQYKSYKSELRHANLKDKKTETYAKIFLESNLEKYIGIPLILETGKKLSEKQGKITINFKQGLTKKLVIYIYPEQRIQIVGGNEKIAYCKNCKFSPNSIDEYSILISEIIKGNKILFATSQEISESWKIIDEITSIKNKIKFIYYKDCSEKSLNN